MLDVEAALARASAAHGVIPARGGRRNRSRLPRRQLDADALMARRGARRQSRDSARQATDGRGQGRRRRSAEIRALGRDEPGHHRYRRGAAIARRRSTCSTPTLRDLCAALATLAAKHRVTPMIGRTWLQQALPITLGLKFAQWLDALTRASRASATRACARARAAVRRRGGHAREPARRGAASRADARRRTRPRAARLCRGIRSATASRKRRACFGMLIGTLGKIARDISLSMQTEVGELAEPAAAGKGGSSTMPHKRNPVGCAAVLTAATRAPDLVATVFAGMVQEHERALGGWQAEWEALPDLARLTARRARADRSRSCRTRSEHRRLAANLDATRGLVLGEAVMLALGDRIGRLDAHQLVERASKEAVASGRTLFDVLSADADRHPASFDRSVATLARSGELRRLGAGIHRCRAGASSRERVILATTQSGAKRHAFAAVNGIQIHYRIDADAGDDAPWLVLSNSLGSDMSMWSPQVEAFVEKISRAALRHARPRPLRRAEGPVHDRPAESAT